MKASELSSLLAVYKKLVDPKAITVAYRCLHLTPKLIRGAASYGIVETKVDLQIDEPCYVLGATFIAVVSSLPADEDIALSVSNSVLSWSCGHASGKMGTVVVENMPTISGRAKAGWKPGEDFVSALRLGALSAGDKALASIGMNGVAINTTDGGVVLSSDKITIAACAFDKGDLNAPDVSTFAPDAIEVLASLIAPNEGALAIDEHGLSYRNSMVSAFFNQCAPLKDDPYPTYAKLSSGKTAIPIPRDAINSFIARAGALAEIKRFTWVTVSIKDGTLSLSFAENTAEAEEYHLLDKKLKVRDMRPLKLNAMLLARALAHAGNLVTDHADGKVGVIVLRGGDPELCYCMAARSNE